jgi:hypothetical protein
MCDYSLYSFPNRLAKDGEQLVVHMFCTGTVGLVAFEPGAEPIAKAEPTGWRHSFKTWLHSLSSRQDPCAVCVPPGARLVLRGIAPQVQKECAVGTDEEVSFTQVGGDAYHYRDAVRFSNGRELLLQRLAVGQRVDVLSIAMPEETPSVVGQAGMSDASCETVVRVRVPIE